MSLIKQKFLGINITINSKKQILEYIQKYLDYSQKSKVKSRKSKQKPLVIVTPNPEQVMMARRDSHFAGILNQADISLPDGMGLVVAMKMLASHSPFSILHSPFSKISGIGFMEDLVAIAARNGLPIALIGGRGGVALKALECLQLRYPGLTGWAEEPGEISNTINTTNIKYYQYCRSIIQKIRATKTRLVFIGLGAPKQEYFMDALRPRMENGEWRMENKQKDLKHLNSQFSILNSCVLMSVGGSFDEISGRIPRPPVFIDKLGFKWLWRLALEPWRIKRQTALLRFIGMAVRELFTK